MILKMRARFFKHEIQKVFLTYSKNIDEYGLIDTTKRPSEVNDEEYEHENNCKNDYHLGGITS